MTLLTNNCEAGVASGTAVTTANSANGTGNSAFTAVSPVTAGAIAYTSSAYRGSLAIAAVQATTANACTFEWSDPTPAASGAVRCYLRLNSYPSATTQAPINVRSAANASLGRLNMTATGQLSITLGTANAVSGVTASALALNTWYRVEVVWTGFNTAASAMTLYVYEGDSTTLFCPAVTLTGQTTTALAGVVRFGRNSAAGTNDFTFDNLALNVGSSALIGPSNSGDAGLDQSTEAGRTVTLTGSGSGTWTQTGGPAVTLSGSGSTRTFPAPITSGGTSLTFAYGGDETVVTVLPARTFVARGGVLVPLVTYTTS